MNRIGLLVLCLANLVHAEVRTLENEHVRAAFHDGVLSHLSRVDSNASIVTVCMCPAAGSMTTASVT